MKICLDATFSYAGIDTRAETGVWSKLVVPHSIISFPDKILLRIVIFILKSLNNNKIFVAFLPPPQKLF